MNVMYQTDGVERMGNGWRFPEKERYWIIRGINRLAEDN